MSEIRSAGYRKAMDNNKQDNGGKAAQAAIRIPLVIIIGLGILVGVYFLAR